MKPSNSTLLEGTTSKTGDKQQLAIYRIFGRLLKSTTIYKLLTLVYCSLLIILFKRSHFFNLSRDEGETVSRDISREVGEVVEVSYDQPYVLSAMCCL